LIYPWTHIYFMKLWCFTYSLAFHPKRHMKNGRKLCLNSSQVFDVTGPILTYFRFGFPWFVWENLGLFPSRISDRHLRNIRSNIQSSCSAYDNLCFGLNTFAIFSLFRLKFNVLSNILGRWLADNQAKFSQVVVRLT
jgi:hypothetical protein